MRRTISLRSFAVNFKGDQLSGAEANSNKQLDSFEDSNPLESTPSFKDFGEKSK